MTQVINALVDAGKASGGPPLGPALGPLGVNIGDIVKAINEKTQSFAGMKVPVKLTINEKTKAFEIEIGTPPCTALIFKELGITKGSGATYESKAGNITMDQVVKIAKMKGETIGGMSVKANAKTIIGTCQSAGITVEGKDPIEIHMDIVAGKYDNKFK
jgi:large subunit ribosomal protein L11